MTVVKNEDGKYSGIAFPGGYFIRYLIEDNEVICATCANNMLSDDDEWEPQRAIILWEGPTEQCAECNRDMPTEYGDPEDPEAPCNA